MDDVVPPSGTGTDDTPNPVIGPVIEAASPGSETVRLGATKEWAQAAKILHDGVLQSLAVCSLKAQLCDRFVAAENYDLARSELSLLTDALDNAIDMLRVLLSTFSQQS